MRTFPAPIFRKISGFTVLELLIVILLISIFVVLASVNWNVAAKKGKESLLEVFSVDVAMIREDAISHYESRVLEFDVSNDEVRAGRLDANNEFVETGPLHLPEEYQIEDVVINGQSFPEGKCYVTFHGSGMVDRTVVHLQGSQAFRTLFINPLTAKVTSKDGYIEEISLKGRDNSP